MTLFAPTAQVHTATRTGFRLGLIARLRRHLARTEAALQAQASRTALSEDMLRDTRLCPEDLTGAPSHDPALPYFLQSGFGRSDR